MDVVGATGRRDPRSHSRALPEGESRYLVAVPDDQEGHIVHSSPDRSEIHPNGDRRRDGDCPLPKWEWGLAPDGKISSRRRTGDSDACRERGRSAVVRCRGTRAGCRGDAARGRAVRCGRSSTTARRRQRERSSWRGLALFPELLFALVLNVIYLKGILDISFAKRARWQHTSQTTFEVSDGVG